MKPPSAEDDLTGVLKGSPCSNFTLEAGNTLSWIGGLVGQMAALCHVCSLIALGIVERSLSDAP